MELLKLENKVRFILAIVKGEIIVSGMFRELICLLSCKQKGFTPFQRKLKLLSQKLLVQLMIQRKQK